MWTGVWFLPRATEQEKEWNILFNLNTGLVYPSSCAGLVSIFPGGRDNDGKLPPPPLDCWAYGLLKDCVSVLINKYLQPLENQAKQGYFTYSLEQNKNLITGIEVALRLNQIADHWLKPNPDRRSFRWGQGEAAGRICWQDIQLATVLFWYNRLLHDKGNVLSVRQCCVSQASLRQARNSAAV